MERDYGHSVSGLGPQAARRRGGAGGGRVRPAATAGGLPARTLPRCLRSSTPSRLACRTGWCAGTAGGARRRDDLARRQRGRNCRGLGGRASTPIRTDHELRVTARSAFAMLIALARRVQQAKGRALIVGGWVRDRLMGRTSQGYRSRGLWNPAAGAAGTAARSSARSTPSVRASPSTRLPGSTWRCPAASRRRGAATAASRSPAIPQLSIRRSGAAPRFHHQRDRLGPSHRRIPRSVGRPRRIWRAASSAPSIRRRSATTR